MTGREKLERRVSAIRIVTYAGFALYLLPLFAVYFFPASAMLIVLGVGVSLLALWLAFNSLRCPDCGKKLGNLLMVKQEGRLLALPPDLSTCPHCGFDLDSYGSHDGLLEIMSAYEDNGAYVGVLDVPLTRGVRRYEAVLSGKARDAFDRVFQLQPFDTNVGGGYRYFFVPRLSGSDPARGEGFTLRIEKGVQVEQTIIPAPQPLVSLLDWLHRLQDGDQVVDIALKETRA
jgi:hypothetical protein